MSGFPHPRHFYVIPASWGPPVPATSVFHSISRPILTPTFCRCGDVVSTNGANCPPLEHLEHGEAARVCPEARERLFSPMRWREILIFEERRLCQRKDADDVKGYYS